MDQTDFINKLATATTNTTVVTFNDINLNIKTDTPPTYYTSFDDEHVVFDSYNADVDSTMQQSKSLISAIREPKFEMGNNFYPDLPSKAFSYLLAEAKSTAFNQLKQLANQKEEQKSRRQRTWLAGEKYRVTKKGTRYTGYGRK